MELFKYRKLQYSFGERFSNYFSFELNRINTIINTLEFFDAIKLFVFVAFTLKIKKFEIVLVR